TRDARLQELLRLHPTLDDSSLADLLMVGIERARRKRGARPDGESGLFFDLAMLEALKKDTWRKRLSDIRGKRNGSICQGSGESSPQLQSERPNGSAKSLRTRPTAASAIRGAEGAANRVDRG